MSPWLKRISIGRMSVGSIFVILVLLGIIGLSFELTGGDNVTENSMIDQGQMDLTPTLTPPPSNVTLVIPTQGLASDKNGVLQLDPFYAITPTPILTPILCQRDSAAIDCNTCPPLPTDEPLYAPFNYQEDPGIICQNSQSDTYVSNTTEDYPCPHGGVQCSNPAFAGGAAWGCTTPNNWCIYLDDSHDDYVNFSQASYDWALQQPDCQPLHNICFGKPVIYLYPDKKMQVAVELDIPGIVTKSIPTYPISGWQDITANPGGLLQYQGKTYNELYYESSVTGNNIIPKSGIVLPINKLSQDLDSFITKMGLIPHERSEFLAYWLPRLYALNKPYIFVSYLSPEQKELVDKVIVNPKPDVSIAFLIYFKGLSSSESFPAPQMPNVPKRTGFTMVEWGGTIGE